MDGLDLTTVVKSMLKQGDPMVVSFNTPDFCLEDILQQRKMLAFLRLVNMLADMKGKFIEDITLGEMPPGAVDGLIGYFNIRLAQPSDFIRKCDGNHAGPACRDAQCWVRSI